VLKIAVLIKQIPMIEDANFDPVTKTIRRDGDNVISAYDLRAVALAMELKARFGADTTVITMGPPQARAAIEDALAMGIDRGVLLSDRAFAGADTLATARALAAWLKPRAFDLILAGKYSLDAETGQVGPEVAAILRVAQASGVRKLEIDGAAIKAERESDEGYEEVETAMPCLVTCAERVAQPIKVKAGATEAAKSKPLEVVGADKLNIDSSQLGFAGSPTWVSEVRAVETPKTSCTFIDPDDPERAAASLIERLDRRGALTPRQSVRRAISLSIRKPAAKRDLWVIVETNLAGAVTRATLEILSRADSLASQLGGAAIAIGIGASSASHAGVLASYGADRMVVLDASELDGYSPDGVARAVASLARERTPWGIFVSASERGRDWGPRLAADLGLGLTGDAIGLELDSQDRLVALKAAFGGNIVAPILSKTYPQMATIRSGVLELGEPNAARRIETEVVRVKLDAPLSRMIRAHSLVDTTLEALESAQVVVGIGTGVGGPDGVAAVKDLARTLRAGMCATRRVTDAGWVPRQLQVGLTGKSIDPRLYFAIGIRGVPNHTVGIKRAQTVVAINNDPEAPIFERADFGIVADWKAVLPALRDAFRNRLA